MALSAGTAHLLVGVGVEYGSIPTLRLLSCVSQRKSLTLLKPQFHHLLNGDDNTNMGGPG